MKTVFFLLLGAGLLHIVASGCLDDCFTTEYVSCINNEKSCNALSCNCEDKWDACTNSCKRKRELKSRLFRNNDDDED